MVLLFIPFTVYFALGENVTSVSPVAQFSIIAVAPTLGGLVLAAASNFRGKPEKREELIRVSQKFITAAVLLMLSVPFIFMVDILGGIDIDSFDWRDSITWFRGIYFWLALPCLYIGIIIFLWGITDLIFALANLDVVDDKD